MFDMLKHIKSQNTAKLFTTNRQLPSVCLNDLWSAHRTSPWCKVNADSQRRFALIQKASVVAANVKNAITTQVKLKEMIGNQPAVIRGKIRTGPALWI
jgi:hypothetical protein